MRLFLSHTLDKIVTTLNWEIAAVVNVRGLEDITTPCANSLLIGGMRT